MSDVFSVLCFCLSCACWVPSHQADQFFLLLSHHGEVAALQAALCLQLCHLCAHMGICQHVELASAGAMWAVIKVTKFVVVWGVAILLDRGV